MPKIQVSGKWWLKTKRWSTGSALLCMHARDQIEYAIKLIIIIIESGGGGLQILLFKCQHLWEPAECLSLRYSSEYRIKAIGDYFISHNL